MTYTPNYVRFGAIFLGLTLAVPLLGAFVSALLGFDVYNSGMQVIPIMIASMVEGARFAKSEQRKLHSSEAWRLALRLTSAAAMISILWAVVSFATWDLSLWVQMRETGGIAYAIAAGLLAVSFFVGVLTSRWVLSVGVTGELRAKVKRAQEQQ